MSDIQVNSAENLHGSENVAGTRRGTPGPDGGHVPGRLAGYVWDGAAYCPECAGDVEVELSPDTLLEKSELLEGRDWRQDDDERVLIPLDQYPAFETDPNGFGVGIVAGWDEADYPGHTCHECHEYLDTNVLIYRDGPGAEHWIEDDE